MSLFRQKGSRFWSYEFQHLGRRYRGSTKQARRKDADLVEGKIKLDVRRTGAGLPSELRPAGPCFQEWAETFFEAHAKRVTRADRLEHLIRGALRFLGRRPEPESPVPIIEGEPYHDLRLTDFVNDARWILTWERWLEAPHRPAPRVGKFASKTPPAARRWSGQTRNQYRSLVSQMFVLAMSPSYREETGIVTNPVAGGWRDRGNPRTVVLDQADVAAILGHANYPLRVAMAIALLTPKFRLGNILALTWKDNISADFSRIVVREHKTARATGRPLVAYVPEQLREILKEVQARGHGHPWVITYRGQPMKSLRSAVRGAIRAARVSRPHLAYGRKTADGITFHTLRHSAITMLAALDISAAKTKQLAGHKQIATTMQYTHLNPSHEAEPAEQLSASLPIKDLVLAPWRRPTRRTDTGKNPGTRATHETTKQGKPANR